MEGGQMEVLEERCSRQFNFPLTKKKKEENSIFTVTLVRLQLVYRILSLKKR